MKKVLVVGAGRSTTAMLRHLIKLAEEHNWMIIVADKDIAKANKWSSHSQAVQSAWLDVTKPNDRSDLVKKVDLVISMVPAHLFYKVARQCIWHRKPVITSPYVLRHYRIQGNSLDIETMDFIMSSTLAIGYDSLIAASITEELKMRASSIEHFTSYSASLHELECFIENPWKYKLQRNTEGFLLENKGFTPFLSKGKVQFQQETEKFETFHQIRLDEQGRYEAYRDKGVFEYRDLCGLEDVPNIEKFTLRHMGFCDAWRSILRLGLTSMDYPISNSSELTYHELLDGIVGGSENTLRARVARFLDLDIGSEIIDKLEWLGLFSRKRIQLEKACPADILTQLLEEKWSVQECRDDFVMLLQKWSYRIGAEKHEKQILMDVRPTEFDSAISRFVGLPLAILAEELLISETLDVIKAPILVKKKLRKKVLDRSVALGISIKDYVA